MAARVLVVVVVVAGCWLCVSHIKPVVVTRAKGWGEDRERWRRCVCGRSRCGSFVVVVSMAYCSWQSILSCADVCEVLPRCPRGAQSLKV